MTEVITEHGNRLQLGERLGQGGQGTVFRVQGARKAVKILHARGDADRRRLRERIAQVQRLPIRELDICFPDEQLAPPGVGYVMEFAEDMAPLSRLLSVPQEIRTEGVESMLSWYVGSGGLRRRLRLLHRLADVLAVLHGKGVAYVDLSPGNVFVSEDPGYSEIRLIDPDNLRSANQMGGAVYTPGYGAPELIRGERNPSSLSDAYAFAVTAFQVLSLAHPLLGDAVLNGPPEEETRALLGEHPWVDDPNDTSNSTSTGLPRQLILTEELRALFQKTFGQGRHDFQLRAGVASFRAALRNAMGATLECPGCRWTFFAPFEKECPRCGHSRPPYLALLRRVWIAERGSVHEGWTKVPLVVESTGTQRTLSAEDCCGEGSGDVLRASFRGTELTLQNLSSLAVHVVRNSAAGTRNWQAGETLPRQPRTYRLQNGEWLHLHVGERIRDHGVLEIRVIGEARP